MSRSRVTVSRTLRPASLAASRKALSELSTSWYAASSRVILILYREPNSANMRTSNSPKTTHRGHATPNASSSFRQGTLSTTLSSSAGTYRHYEPRKIGARSEMLFPMARNRDCVRQMDRFVLPQTGDPKVKIVHSGILSAIAMFRQLRFPLRCSARCWSRLEQTCNFPGFLSADFFRRLLSFCTSVLPIAASGRREPELTPLYPCYRRSEIICVPGRLYCQAAAECG
jgi:hypothetical protein